MLKKADAGLFQHKESEYSTDCGRNQARQPIVLTREELDRSDRMFPGAHSGAIVGYGSSEEKAKVNAYICPKVWCPKSRVALSSEQFEELGRKCPFPGVNETPMLFNGKYFEGKQRYPGFLDGKKHPKNLCMPCCFIKPKNRIGKCAGATLQQTTPTTSTTSTTPTTPTTTTDSQSPMRDVKYIRGDMSPLEAGRYGMLPSEIAVAFGTPKCGMRDDGSGQLMLWKKCYARRGLAFHTQPFLAALAHVLHIDGGADAFVERVVANLQATDFMFLDAGRLCRRFMNGIVPSDVLADSTTGPAFHAWATSKSGISFAAAFHERSGGPKHMRVHRDVMIWASMQRYLAWLSDQSVVKTHRDSGLLELVSRRPQGEWLRPVNVLLIERMAPQTTKPRMSYIVCPQTAPTSYFRLNDPTALLVRNGPHYEPVVHITVGRNGTIAEVSDFSAEGQTPVGNAVRSFLTACSQVPRPDVLGAAIAILQAEGHPVDAQVLDYSFRLVGFSCKTGLFVPVAWDLPVSMLVGEAGSKMKLMYVSDVGATQKQMQFPDAATASRVLSIVARRVGYAGLEPREILSRSHAMVLANGAIVPLKGFDIDAAASAGYLRHLAVFVEAGTLPDPRTILLADINREAEKEAEMQLSIAHALIDTPEMARELVALRSPSHPLSLDDRRSLMASLVQRITMDTMDTMDTKGTAGVPSKLVEKLLFHPEPLRPGHHTTHTTTSTTHGQDRKNEVVLTDIEIASGILDSLITARDNSEIAASDPHQLNKGLLKRAQRVPGVPLGEKLIMTVTRVKDESDDDQSDNANTHPSSSSKPHRSNDALSKMAKEVPMVDPYIVMHLAHRMLHSDAYIPFRSLVLSVQDRIASAFQKSTVKKKEKKEKNKNKNKKEEEGSMGMDDLLFPTDGTLAVLRANGAPLDVVLAAVADRSVGYVTSTFELAILSEILDVSLKMLPVPAPVPASAHATMTTSLPRDLSLLENNGNRRPCVVMRPRFDRAGHDLVLAPSPAWAVPGSGHRLLFYPDNNVVD